MMRGLGTRLLGLFSRLHRCADGPMQGKALILTENSRSTAWLIVNGHVGRYVTDKRGRLVWERAESAVDAARQAGA